MASSRISQMVRPGGRYESSSRQFLIERERPVAAHGQHADEFLVAEADQIGVLGVELVHQPLVGGRLVLRNFLDEGPVIEPVNLLELPVFRRQLEYQRFRGFIISVTPVWARHRGAPTTRQFPRQILPVRKQNHGRQNGDQRRRQAIAVEPEAGERQAGEGKHSRQNAFSRQGEPGQKQHGEGQGHPVIKHQQRAEEVATPLPPRKRNCAGQMCPATTASMASAAS